MPSPEQKTPSPKLSDLLSDIITPREIDPSSVEVHYVSDETHNKLREQLLQNKAEREAR